MDNVLDVARVILSPKIALRSYSLADLKSLGIVDSPKKALRPALFSGHQFSFIAGPTVTYYRMMRPSKCLQIYLATAKTIFIDNLAVTAIIYI